MKPDQYFTDVIARPMTGLRGIHGKAATDKPRHELEVTAEDEQQFLMRQENEDVIMEHPGMLDIDIFRLTKLNNIDDLV